MKVQENRATFHDLPLRSWTNM